MAYKLKVDVEGLPKGTPVQIAGLGEFENGSTYTVSEDEHDAFRRYHGRVVPALGEEQEIVGTEVELGPTLIQSNIHGVEVTKVKRQSNSGSSGNTGQSASQTEDLGGDPTNNNEEEGSES